MLTKSTIFCVVMAAIVTLPFSSAIGRHVVPSDNRKFTKEVKRVVQTDSDHVSADTTEQNDFKDSNLVSNTNDDSFRRNNIFGSSKGGELLIATDISLTNSCSIFLTSDLLYRILQHS